VRKGIDVAGALLPLVVISAGNCTDFFVLIET